MVTKERSGREEGPLIARFYIKLLTPNRDISSMYSPIITTLFFARYKIAEVVPGLVVKQSSLSI